MLALPLVVKGVGYREINFSIEKAGDSYYSIFNDQGEGGNGACESLFVHFKRVAQVAHELCETRLASDHLYQQGCPDGNRYLVNEMGLVLLKAIIDLP